MKNITANVTCEEHHLELPTNNKSDKQIMENELQNFLKDLKKPEISTSNLISANEINSETAFYSY